MDFSQDLFSRTSPSTSKKREDVAHKAMKMIRNVKSAQDSFTAIEKVCHALSVVQMM